MWGLLRSKLRGSAILHRIRFAFYIVPYIAFARAARVRPGRVLFLSDSRDDYSGNFEFLHDAILRQDPNADVVGVFKPSLSSSRPLRDIVRLPWLIATAQTIVVDDFYPLIYSFKIRPEARLVQVWHAAGAFKRVGWSRAGLPGGPLPGSAAHRNYTDATVSSEAVRADYAEAFRIDMSRVHALGVPRTDAFFNPEGVQRASERIRREYGIPAERKIVLFAPTFRGNGQRSATFDFDSVPWQRVVQDLGDDWVLMVKMHPFVTPLLSARPHVTGLIDVSAEREMTDLLMAADVLVTDYSSAIFEYALLRRPIVFYCPDLEEYTSSRSFYHPFSEYLCGPVIHDGAELAETIRNARTTPALDSFIDMFMSACDGDSSERIAREVLLRPRITASVERAAVAPASGPEPTRADGPLSLRLVIAWVARKSLTAVYAPLKLLPVRRKIVMLSREHPAEPEDFADLREAIHRIDPSLTVVSLVRMVPPGVLGKARYSLHMLRQLYHVATARVLLLDTYSIVASVLSHRPELTIIQMWHALGAFKKFGRSILGKPEGRDERLADAMRMHEGYDIVLASGRPAVAAYAEAFGTPESRIRVLPLPRVDRLRDPARREAQRTRVLAAHPHLSGQRVALFAPTFRLDGEIGVDVRALHDALKANGIHLVVKLHPLMHAEFEGVDDAPGFGTQDLLTVADIFITDYSSVMFEAAIVGVPSYFLSPDVTTYLAARDFYLDYRTDLPGPLVMSIADLIDRLETAPATAGEARAFARRWVEVPGNLEPQPGTAVCTDALARLVIEAAT